MKWGHTELLKMNGIGIKGCMLFSFSRCQSSAKMANVTHIKMNGKIMFCKLTRSRSMLILRMIIPIFKLVQYQVVLQQKMSVHHSSAEAIEAVYIFLLTKLSILLIGAVLIVDVYIVLSSNLLLQYVLK